MDEKENGKLAKRVILVCIMLELILGAVYLATDLVPFELYFMLALWITPLIMVSLIYGKPSKSKR